MLAACQAASDPAIPPPMICNVSLMGAQIGQKPREGKGAHQIRGVKTHLGRWGRNVEVRES